MISLLLPTPGDPLLFETWVSNFRKYEHLIDECLICVNHLVTEYPITKETNEELNKFYESFRSEKIKIFYNHNINNHGLILKFLYEKAKGDIIFLMEDDDFILNISLLNTNFNKIKNGECEIIGIPRNCCSSELIRVFGKKYNRSDIGFWPTNFICKKSLIDQTELNFSEKQFKSGELIKELDYVATENMYADTMVFFSLQLNSLTNNICYVKDAYHSSIDDNINFSINQNQTELIGSLHIGSLSSTYTLFLFDCLNKKHAVDFINQYNTDRNTTLEYLRRFIYLNLLLEKIDNTSFYYERYRKNLCDILNLFDENDKNYFDLNLTKKIINKI